MLERRVYRCRVGDEQALAIVKQAARDAQEVVEKLVDLGCEQVAVCAVLVSGYDYLPAHIEQHLIAPKGSAEQGNLVCAATLANRYAAFIGQTACGVIKTGRILLRQCVIQK